MCRRFRLALLAALLAAGPVLSPVSLQANVVREEPNPYTIEGSDWIGLARVVEVASEGSFVHGAPPAVTLRPIACYKGCRRKDTILVKDWTSTARPTAPYTPEDVRQWKRSPVEIPANTDVVLVFLQESVAGEYVQYRNGWGQPIWFSNPEEPLVKLTRGLLD